MSATRFCCKSRSTSSRRPARRSLSIRRALTRASTAIRRRSPTALPATPAVASSAHAEADSIVRLFADANPLSNGAIDGSDVAQGLTVAVPLDGNLAFPAGQWRQAVIRDLNDPGFFPFDGLRQMGATAEDVAGNVSPASFLNVFVDTEGPQVTNVHITGVPGTTYNLFGLKPGNASQGPTPPVNSLTINLTDQPARDGVNFANDVAILAALAATPGNYVLVGDASGIIAIEQVIVVNNPVVDGQPATATIQLVFANPLPDDRFTLTLKDAIVDLPGNRLDGESNAAEPNGAPTFPSGDGVPGGGFVARFTVDSRPEIGVTASTRVYVDINGNFTYDPEGSGDITNKDLIFQLGLESDAYFAGNFAAANAVNASGFDKLGVFGFDPFLGQYRFLLDFDHNGVPDFSSTVLGLTTSGLPVSGDFAPRIQAMRSACSWVIAGTWTRTVTMSSTSTSTRRSSPACAAFRPWGTSTEMAATICSYSMRLRTCISST